ncbi:MAG TPA: PEP-CTERM sorting domain-containing protein [Candidatus Bathyarchaeia archaeon]|nr:PEP-CTERM sorting domain-containing protein [Candidatus Bathyarchaeia archaeon]
MKKLLLSCAVLLLAVVQASATATTLSFFDANGGLLYTTNLTFLTGGGTNTGMTLGFTSSGPNISSFTMTDNYIALTELVVNGTPVAIPAVDYFGGGPQVFGPGITWSSTNLSYQGGSVFGLTGGYGFAGNGFWDGALGPMIGLNDSFDYYGVTDTMTFTFDEPVTSVSAFFNYVPSSNPTPEPGTMLMLGSGVIGLAGVLRRKINL